MFEKIYVDPHRSHIKNKHRRVRELLRRYAELQLTQNERKNGKVSKKTSHPKTPSSVSLAGSARPEETYEVWNKYPNLNANLQGRDGKGVSNVDEPKNGKRRSGNSHFSQEEDDFLLYPERSLHDPRRNNNIDNNQDILDDEIGTVDEVNESLDQEIDSYIHNYDTKKSWVKENFLVSISGLETFPEPTTGYSTYHLNNLKNLLHINMLRKNWNLAYKIFCILIRMNYVDIRTIWPLGIEILQHTSKNSPLFAKDEKFFEWLFNFFTISKATSNLTRTVSAPIWRSGSKYHVPLYIVTFLWTLLTKKKYSKLSDKIDELILEPPFNSEGIFYYLQVLCLLGETLQNQGTLSEGEIAQIKRNLETAKKLGFTAPVDNITNIIDQLNAPQDASGSFNVLEMDFHDPGYNDDDANEATAIPDAQVLLEDNFAPFTDDELYPLLD